MKRFSKLFIIINLILILFPSCVFGASQKEREDALCKFVEMDMVNVKFLDRSDGLLAKMGYNGIKAGDKLPLNAYSFVDFVYNNVFNFDMTKDGSNEPLTGDDLKNTNKYFEKREQGIDVSKNTTIKFEPGDLLVGGSDYVIYLGKNSNGQEHVARLVDGVVKIQTLKELKDKTFDVMRLKNPDGVSVNKNASFNMNNFKNTTIKAELDKLHLENEFSFYSNGNYFRAEMKNISRSTLANAFALGYASEYGETLKDKTSIRFYITYKNSNNYGKVFNNTGSLYDYFEIKIGDKSSDKKLEGSWFDKFCLEDYVENGLGYEPYGYLTVPNDKSLYLSIKLDENGDYIYSASVTNGKMVDGEIEAFTDGTIADAPLSDFTNGGENTQDPGNQNNNTDCVKLIDQDVSIKKGDFEYRKDDKGNPYTNQFYFKVNKSGYYMITGIYQDGSEKYLSNNITSIPPVPDRISVDAKPYRTAGTLTGNQLDKGPEGEYMTPLNPYGGSAVIPLCANFTYVLFATDLDTDDDLFEVFSTVDFKLVEETNELVEICDLADLNSIDRPSQSFNGVQVAYIAVPEPASFFDSLERLIAFFVRNIANGIVYIIRSTLGWVDATHTNVNVTIDTIVFDDYEPVQLALFTDNEKYGMTPGVFVSEFRNNVNEWYNVFRSIAIVAYLIMFLYMGIRIVMASTGNQKALYKELFTHWCSGVIILFLFPIIIKYAILMNHSVVKMVQKSVEKETAAMANTDNASNAQVDPNEASGITNEDETSEEAKNMEANPFSDTDPGYMAVMATLAHKTERLSYAIIYLIMSFQLMIIAMMYYKRLFMVAFLILLFPIVMIMYVLEKVGNIKTSAFSKWVREIMITIFIQSIHAITYAFCMATVGQAGVQGDWILMIMGVTFLFNGEGIIKKILGKETITTRSLADTASRTALAFSAVSRGVSNLTDNVIGAGSHLGQTISHVREARKNRFMAKNIEMIGDKPASIGAGVFKAENLPHFASVRDEMMANGASESEIEEARTLAEAVLVFNNRDQASPEQLANAMATIDKSMKENKHGKLLRDLNVNAGQFKELNRLRDSTMQAASDGSLDEKAKQSIDMRLSAEIERILPDEDVTRIKCALYSQMSRPLMNGALNGANPLFNRVTDRNEIVREINESREKTDNIKRRMQIAETKTDRYDRELATKAVDLLERTYQKGYKYSAEQYRMALSVVMVKEAMNGEGGEAKFDAHELMSSMNFISKNRGKGEGYGELVADLGEDVDQLRYALAEKICDEGFKTENFRRTRRNTGSLEVQLDRRDGESDADFNKRYARMKEVCSISLDVIDGYEGTDIVENSIDGISFINVDAYSSDSEEAGGTISEARKIEELAEDIATARQERNTADQNAAMRFANEMLEKNKKINEYTYNGMSADELIEKARVAQTKAEKEALRTVATTAASAFMAPIGAAVGIGLSDDEGVLTEAFVGGLAAANVGDFVAETATSDGLVTQKVKIRNPYTGELEEVEVTSFGGFADDILELDGRELGSNMSAKLREQFLDHKIAKDYQENEARKARIQTEENRQKVAEAYRKAYDEATRNRNNNS